MSVSPVVETERLVLRPHGPDDLADCAAMWGDPVVVTFIGNGQPLTAEETWSRMLRYAGGWRLLGYGYWAIREKDGGRFVGDVGFQNLRRAMVPPFGDRPEIGWVLAAHAQGSGYAAEAVAGALEWADAHLVAPETACIIRPDHARSIRIALRAGYARTGSALYKSSTVDIFARPRAPRGFQTTAAIPTS